MTTTRRIATFNTGLMLIIKLSEFARSHWSKTVMSKVKNCAQHITNQSVGHRILERRLVMTYQNVFLLLSR